MTNEEEIETLTLDECKQLLIRAATPMQSAWENGHQKTGKDEDFRCLLGYIVLALFAGIRPDEIADEDTEWMPWSAVDLEHKTAIVTAARSKTRQRRVVDLSDNAVAWLKLCDREGSVIPANFKKRWLRLRIVCGWASPALAEKLAKDFPGVKFRKWPHDVLRHTFASMHYAHYKNELS